MLDRDLAELYGVTTKRLNEQVRRNRERFPGDFMFQLSWEETRELERNAPLTNCGRESSLRSQNATLEAGAHIKYRPCAFTEQGVAMLSSVLRSTRAVQVNIEIMRVFVQLRRMLASHEELARKLAQMEKKYDAQFKVVFDVIRQLMNPPESPKAKEPFGFHPRKKK